MIVHISLKIYLYTLCIFMDQITIPNYFSIPCEFEMCFQTHPYGCNVASHCTKGYNYTTTGGVIIHLQREFFFSAFFSVADLALVSSVRQFLEHNMDRLGNCGHFAISIELFQLRRMHIIHMNWGRDRILAFFRMQRQVTQPLTKTTETVSLQRNSRGCQCSE